MRRINRFTPIEWQNCFYEKMECLIIKEEKKQWELQGCPIQPPYEIKQVIINYYAEFYGFEILIETGTCPGDKISSQKGKV
jgi:hypothetical protein